MFVIKKQITEMTRVVAVKQYDGWSSISLSYHLSTIDVQKQFTGFNRSKAGPVKNGHSSHSDEEKKKKNLRQKRKNGKKKGNDKLLPPDVV